MVASVGRLGAFQERRRIRLARAARVGQQVGVLVQLHHRYAGGSGKLPRVGILRQLHRRLHELRPDRRGRQRPGQLHVGVVVVAHPHDANQIAGVTREPRVVRGPRLSRRRGHESPPPGLVPVAEVHHPLHHRGRQIRDPRIEDRLRGGRIVVQHVAGGRTHRRQHPRVDLDAAIGEDGVRARHIQRRRAVRPKRNRGRALRRPNPRRPRQRGHVVEPHHLRQRDRRVVQRVRKRVGRRHLAMVFVLVVVRVVLLVVAESEGRLLVVQHRHRGEERVVAVVVQLRPRDRRVEGARIDERFEDGSRGPLRHRMVQLAQAVVASAHQRQHLSGMRIQRHQRDLRIGEIPGRRHRAVFGLVRVLLQHHLINQFRAEIDRLRRRVLQIRIERGVDAQTLMVEAVLAQFLRQLLPHQIDEVRRLAGVHARRSQLERRGLRCLGLRLGDRPGLDHRVQHQVAPRHRPFRMPVGIQPARALDHPRQQRAFGQVELPYILAEIRLRRLAESVDRETPLLPERNLIGVHLEDLLLVEPALQLEGDDDLDQLALDPLLRSQEEAARQLHRQRRTALHVVVASRQIVLHRAQQPDVVHPAMLEKAPVLDRGHRVHQILGQLLVGHQPSFRPALLLGKPGDQQRLQLVSVQAHVAVAGDGGDDAVVEDDRRAVLRMVRLRAGMHGDRIGRLREMTHRRRLARTVLAVARVPQLLRHRARREMLSGPHLARRGIDLRRVLEQWLRQPLIDNVLVPEPVEAEHRRAEQQHNRDGGHGHLQETELELARVSDFYFDCQELSSNLTAASPSTTPRCKTLSS